MNVLLDSNILLRSIQPDHPQHELSIAQIEKNRANNDESVVCPQSLYEFWVVATRPKSVNGLGLTVSQAMLELQKLRKLFRLCEDDPHLYPVWEKLIEQYQVKGKNAHDARLVAAMSIHAITHLCTFNIEDFRRYDGIILIDPAAQPS